MLFSVFVLTWMLLITARFVPFHFLFSFEHLSRVRFFVNALSLLADEKKKRAQKKNLLILCVPELLTKFFVCLFSVVTMPIFAC